MDNLITTKDFITNRVEIPYYIWLSDESIERLHSNLLKYKIDNVFGVDNSTKISKTKNIIDINKNHKLPVLNKKININKQYIDDTDIVNDLIYNLRRKEKIFDSPPAFSIKNDTNPDSIHRRIMSKLISCNSLLLMDNKMCSPTSIKCIYGDNLHKYIDNEFESKYMYNLGYHIQYVSQLEKDEVIFYITTPKDSKIVYNGWCLFRWSDKYKIEHVGIRSSVYRTKFCLI